MVGHRTPGVECQKYPQQRNGGIALSRPSSPIEACEHILDSIEGTLGVAVCDLGTGKRWDRAGDVSYNPASTIKVPVMIEVFRRRDAGTLDLDQPVRMRAATFVGGSGVIKELHDGVELSVRDLVHLMIVISDNTATNALVDIVSPAGATEAAHQCGAHATFVRRKLMLGPGSPPVENAVTANDLVTIMAALHNGTAASAASCDEMLEVLKRQQVNDRIPLLLPHGTLVAHKTGELRSSRHDAGIVYPQGEGRRPYAVAFLTSQLEDPIRASRQLAEASLAIYEWFERAG